MVLLKDKWKLDPKCAVNIDDLTFETLNIEEVIREKGMEFTDENYHWVERNILTGEAFSKEKEARACMLNLFILYERVATGSMRGSEDNDYLLLNETCKKIRDEFNRAINKVFCIKINEKRLHKRSGESMEHYLMRCAILDYLNKKFGVKDFKEEYSKLKEVLDNVAKGASEDKEWEKVAKRADLYVILIDESKLWIEVERTTSSSEITKKLKRLKVMLSHFPNLFDKVVFVFSSLIVGMAEAVLTEAREIGFPEEKIEIYEVNIQEGKIIQFTNLRLIDVEFGDRMLDMIADGCGEPTKKTARVARDTIKEKVIIPLVNNEWDYEYVTSKKEKLRRLISFWRKHTRKLVFGYLDETKKSEIDVEFKINALKTIKQNYPFLLK